MTEPEILDQMRSDWNARASEDFRYYVAFGRRGQQDEEFFASATEVVHLLEAELKRIPREISPEARRALEIGCGPGRLMRPLSRHFGEIHGVDVSDKMIRLAGQRLRNTSNAFPHHSSGSDLSLFPAEKFDYVYSYARSEERRVGKECSC